ncbi:MAG: hypothetical protein AAB847_02940 [Patescibacteria group bacterium]
MRVPEDRILKNALEKAGHEHGIQIKKLSRGDILKILIGNKLFTVRIINPEEGRAMVIDDEKWTISPNSMIYILGSSLSGTGAMLKIGWIAIDYLICIEFDEKEFYGYIKKVWLNEQLVLPYNENN